MGDDVFDDVSSFSIRPAMDLFDSTMSVRMAMMALLNGLPFKGLWPVELSCLPMFVEH